MFLSVRSITAMCADSYMPSTYLVWTFGSSPPVNLRVQPRRFREPAIAGDEDVPVAARDKCARGYTNTPDCSVVVSGGYSCQTGAGMPVASYFLCCELLLNSIRFEMALFSGLWSI